MTVTVAPVVTNTIPVCMNRGTTGATGRDLRERSGATGADFAAAPVAPRPRTQVPLVARLVPVPDQSLPDRKENIRHAQ